MDICVFPNTTINFVTYYNDLDGIVPVVKLAILETPQTSVFVCFSILSFSLDDHNSDAKSC